MNTHENSPSQKTAFLRSADEIESRLKKLKLDQAYCEKWHDDAYEKYKADRNFFGKKQADPTEYLHAGEMSAKLAVQIIQLEWVLGLRS